MRQPQMHGIGRHWLLAGVLPLIIGSGGAWVPPPPTPHHPEASTAGPPWGASAVALLTDELAAGHEGVGEAAMFTSPDVELDDRPWGGRMVRGRDEYRNHLVQKFGTTMEEVRLDTIFIEPGGAFLQLRYATMPGFSAPVHAFQGRMYGSHGVEVIRNALSVDTLRRRPGALADVAAPLALVERYAAAWSGDPDAIRALYRPDAEVVDTIRGIRAVGTADIVRLAATQSGELRVALIPGTQEPAVYVDNRLPQLASTVSAIFDVVTGCAGQLAVELRVQGGAIAEERRVQEVGTVRRCEEQPPGGWWLAATPHHADAAVIELGGALVEVQGGSPGLEQLLQWGVDRFTAGGLDPPQLERVTFAQATSRCAGVAGRAAAGDAGAHLTFCLGDEAACDDEACESAALSARMTVLHELAHAWAFTHLDPSTQQAYLSRIPSGRWHDHALPWADRGIERAAETLMWGLLDRNVPLPRIGDPDPAVLRDDFGLLTGRQPLREVQPGRVPARTTTS